MKKIFVLLSFGLIGIGAFSIIGCPPPGEPEGTIPLTGGGGGTGGGNLPGTLASFDSLILRIFNNDTSALPPGSTRQIDAYAKYSDGSEVKITDQASWMSSDGAKASVAKGLVTANANTTWGYTPTSYRVPTVYDLKIWGY